MTTLNSKFSAINNKRVISKETLLKQQIIEYTKSNVLASKIILDEDFDVLVGTPLIFLPHVIKNQPYLSLALSTTTFVLITKYNHLQPRKNMLWSLLPLGYEIVHRVRHWWNKYSCFKVVENFVKCLEEQAALNNKVLKHLKMRMSTLEDLQNKINENAFNMIQENDHRFAHNTCESFTNVCQTLQKQLIIQDIYSNSQYSYIGHWSFETCPENATFYDTACCIEKLSQLYILLASNLMNSTVFALEAAFWQLEQDFQTVFNTLLAVVNLLKKTTHNMEVNYKETFSALQKTNKVPKTIKKEDKKQSVYTEALEECKNRVRMVFELANTLETQNSETRGVFLEEMLENFEMSTLLVRNLLRYEKSLIMSDNFMDKVVREVNKVQVNDRGGKCMITNDKEAEIGSDDEEFAYSPCESDDEFDRKRSKNKKTDNCEDYNQDSKKSLAVQNLMLQELRNRMKDVRRIKISRTPAGDLIVKERPMTLQESGGQNTTILGEMPINSEQTSVETPLEGVSPPTKVVISIGVPPPPPIPLNLPKFNLSENDIDNTCAIQPTVNKTVLASISSLAKQRNRNEDVFGCDGDEYVPTDESSDDELTY